MDEPSRVQRDPYGGFRPTPRNAPCPCGLARRYKHCHGRPGDRSEELAAALAKRDGGAARERVYIAGCARSGTTMLQCMMLCFDEAWVEPGEWPVARFLELERPERLQVVKRDVYAWRVLPQLPAEISVVYLVRHPFDVLTSRHPRKAEGFWVNLARWQREFEAFRRLEAERAEQGGLVVLRYEDLVEESDPIQARLAARWGLTGRLPFSRFPEALADLDLPEDSHLFKLLGGLRPPDPQRLYRWRQDERHHPTLRRLAAEAPADFRAFLERFGYRDEGILPAA